MSYEKTCAFCGKPFTTENPKKKYCTVKCQCEFRYAKNRAARKLEPRECKVCHKMFDPVRPSHVCCSRVCTNKFFNSLRKEIRDAKPKKLYSKVCPHCHREFRTEELKRKACSEKCAKAIMRAQNQAAYLAKNPNAGSRIRAKQERAKSADKRRQARDRDGLTAEERNAVIRAQNGPREDLWRASIGWTPAQRRFAKRRYEAIHPFSHAASGWY